MIRYFEDNRFRNYVIGFHLLLGFISIFTPIIFIGYFYFILFSFSRNLFVGNLYLKKKNFLFIFVYLNSFELMARMTGTSPFIPYELSKYLMFILLVFGIISFKGKGYLGWFLFFLLIPSVFIDVSNSVSGYEPYSFNLLGPLNVALSVILFYNFKISFLDFQNVLFYLLLTCISVLAFTYFKTPDFDKIQFTLAANFDTTGGFGSNQVSTVLGLGMFLSFLFLFNNWNITNFRYLDILIFVGFLFQGLLSFSRGGILGGIIGIIIVFYYNSISVKNKISKIPKAVYVIVLMLPIVFFIANNLSDGLLLKRYQGETAGTLGGYREKTLNVATSNRYDIFLGDLELWSNYPIFGVGIGASKQLRSKVTDVVAHVELSRLLAEHGLFGFLYFLCLMLYVYLKIKKNRIYLQRGLLFSFFFIAIFTSFHAAMRTYVTPLMIGLSLVTISSVALISKKHSI